VFTQVQADVKAEANTQLALQDAQEAEKHMHSLSEHETTVVSVLQSTQKDLDAIDNFEDTYLKPLQIFDVVIGEIADVHPYAKMAFGVLSRAAKIILAQKDRDAAVLKLLKKFAYRVVAIPLS
jgi:hypothetical protein